MKIVKELKGCFKIITHYAEHIIPKPLTELLSTSLDIGLEIPEIDKRHVIMGWTVEHN